MQIERPPIVGEMIQALLTHGSVEDLKSPQGQFLRQLMTPGEVDRTMDLPVTYAKGFDGVTCDFCRGDYRFRNCGACRGSFDALPVGEALAAQRALVERSSRENLASDPMWKASWGSLPPIDWKPGDPPVQVAD